MELVAPDTAENKPAIVPLRFWIDHEESDKAGSLREVHWVEYAKIGTNSSTTVDKVARIKKHSPVVWGVIEPYYEAWAKGQEEPTEGTALTAWPGVTRGQVDQLRLLNLRSVEELAGVDESALERIGMGARALRDKARAFVKASEGQAALAGLLGEKDAQIDDLSEQLAELTKTVAALSADKPKRTKPRDAAKGAAQAA